MARSLQSSQGAAVLTFHGLREDGKASGVLDESLHLPLSVFRETCLHLAAHYQVLPLAEIVAFWQAGKTLPARTVAITFDDGYASNFQLGYPVLRELGLPATVFLATGFIDGTQPLWFQQVDGALSVRDQGRAVKLAEVLRHLKSLPDAEMRAEVAKLVEGRGALPAPLVTLPMTWKMVREMQQSGLIDFGGHTHSHPILARCSAKQQALEISTCRDRMLAELGTAPKLFAYPNGSASDYSAETQRLLSDNGFEAAFTMVSGRASAKSDRFALPRYGSPESVWEAEATASGAFEMLRAWRGGRR